MSATETRYSAGARYRAMNTIRQPGQRMRADTLMTTQQVTAEDLIALAGEGRIRATVQATRAALDLESHLANGGDPALVAISLTRPGFTAVHTATNRVLLAADSRPHVRASDLLAEADVDIDKLASICAWRLVAVTHADNGEPVDPAELRGFPARNLLVRVTDKGRQYLPF